jgi:hypothetical protein
MAQTIIQSLHLRVGEFESHLEKRLLQQYLPTMEVPTAIGAEAPYANHKERTDSGEHR